MVTKKNKKCDQKKKKTKKNKNERDYKGGLL
jgi:hypothetical protein